MTESRLSVTQEDFYVEEDPDDSVQGKPAENGSTPLLRKFTDHADSPVAKLALLWDYWDYYTILSVVVRVHFDDTHEMDPIEFRADDETVTVDRGARDTMEDGRRYFECAKDRIYVDEKYENGCITKSQPWFDTVGDLVPISSVEVIGAEVPGDV